MKFLVQRVESASVEIDGKIFSAIEKGFFVLVGVCAEDTREDADRLVKKLTGMRIFADENGKTNLGLSDVGGKVLLVSQFTLYADCKRGNRPSFIKAGDPAHAEELYEYVIKSCKDILGAENVGTGTFGADMKCTIINDGPFTIDLDSDELK